jgi:hypothetical protein
MRLPLTLAAILVSLPALAQTPTPPPAQPTPPTIEQQANAEDAAITASQTRIAAITQNWLASLIALGNQRDNLQAQVSVLTKDRDDAKAALAKAQTDTQAAEKAAKDETARTQADLSAVRADRDVQIKRVKALEDELAQAKAHQK